MQNNLLNNLSNTDKTLCTIDEKTLNYFNFNSLVFVAKPCSIYDGDTFTAIFIFNGVHIKHKCRCIGYDCAEIKPKLNDPNREQEKKLAQLAKTRFTELITAHPSGLCVIECGEFDKYGRILVKVYNGVEISSVNDIMIKEGHGRVYNGGTKEEW